MIYNFCGETKGKTSSALGTMVRALGANQKVRAVFFMKHWNTSETEFLNKIKDNFDLDFVQSGDKDFIYAKDVNHTTINAAQDKLKFGKIAELDDEDIKKANRGLIKAHQYLNEKPFLLILDELNYAISFGLFSLEEGIELLEIANRNETHIIITGKELHPELAKKCDLITEMKKIKHPFDKGKYAVKGLDY